MPFDYFYGKQGEQHAFYRIPKLLFTDSRFQTLSTDAKLLYGMLIDRMELSLKNGWIDAHTHTHTHTLALRITPIHIAWL